MDQLDPAAFAASWLDAWNRHDVEAVLDHFADDAVFTSPVAAQVLPETRGVLDGKPAIRHYWTTALALIPDLRFELVGVYAGIDTVVLHYRNHRATLVCEVLRVRDGLVVRGDGTYPELDAAAASGVQPSQDSAETRSTD